MKLWPITEAGRWRGSVPSDGHGGLGSSGDSRSAKEAFVRSLSIDESIVHTEEGRGTWP